MCRELNKISCDSDGKPIADLEVCVGVDDLNKQYAWLISMSRHNSSDELIGMLNFYEDMRQQIRDIDATLCPTL